MEVTLAVFVVTDGGRIMKTIEALAAVTPDHKLLIQVQVPPEVIPGEHRVVVMIEENLLPVSKPERWDFPVIDVGPWPENLSLRREDMYGDDGR